MYVYIFAVKSNLETETCTFILIMSFGTCLFPLKMKQHKHENYNIFSPIHLQENNVSKHMLTNSTTSSQASSSHQ